MSSGRSLEQQIQVNISIPSNQSTHSPWHHNYTYEQYSKNVKHEDRAPISWESTNQTYTTSSSRSEPAETTNFNQKKPKRGDIKLTQADVVELDHSDADADDEGSHTPRHHVGDLSENEAFSVDDPHERTSTSNEPGSSDPSVPPSLTRSTRIRFRSRVRIKSGINPHRHGSPPRPGRGTEVVQPIEIPTGHHDLRYLHLITPASSISVSPSSSISAPLRSRTDDEADKPGWGPLGRRVSLFAGKKKKNGHGQTQGRQAGAEHLPNSAIPNETSPLLVNSTESLQYLVHSSKKHCYHRGTGSYHGRLSPEEVDQEYGRWPGRALNHRWWWWHAESVICCRCLDESDDDYHN